MPAEDAGQATVEFPAGNQPPRLMRSRAAPAPIDSYRLEWSVDDPDGDPVNVKLHLATDLQHAAVQPASG